MLTSILRSLGFAKFDWWKHDMPDASNGWMHDDDDGRIGISLNLAATKVNGPLVAPEQLLPILMSDRMRPFDRVLADYVARGSAKAGPEAEQDPLLTQRLHMALTEARMRIIYLEREIEQKK